MLRALVATVGVLLIGLASTGNAAPCAGFVDVDSTSPFCANVTWIKNRAITLGCPSTGAPLYCPNDSVTRLQMAAFMNRLGNVTFQQGGNAFGGVAQLGTTDNQPVEALVNGAPALRIEPHPISPNVLAGYTINGLVYPGVYGASIGGGGAPGNVYAGGLCPYAFGCQNSATDHFGTIGGGVGNLVGDTDGSLTNRLFGTVGGGFANSASDYGTVGGGRNNQAIGAHSTVGGGRNNQAIGEHSNVPGGANNRATGEYGVVLGAQSWATGDFSVAIGTNARAGHFACFVFSDFSSNNVTSCGANNQFVARAKGGFYMFTGGADDATYTGAILEPGSNAWAPGSDRAGKHEIEPVNPQEVLRKVAAMPVSTWQWKSEPGSIRHMGAMAQDFHAAFGLGSSDKRIVTIDADGVALAAIQGLNTKVEHRLATKDAEIAALRAELADLRSLKAEVASIRAAQSRDDLERR